ncbi:hypothetical protein C5167_025233 [Papaver somniferum]|uniref:Uncharacterized protein n=1 Tax=Papaver somniferum TaxID=3469 RepID=A0A4Y7JRX2_PAPSO|nr:hypothetical protein C5167_025233 [Papaver somniferum]
MDRLVVLVSQIFGSLAAACSLLQLLWICDDGVPYLGGINKDDSDEHALLMNCIFSTWRGLVLLYNFSFPGGFSLQISHPIHQLPVNSLLRSNQINEMEGGALFVFDLYIFGSHEKTGFHEASALASAFGMQSKLNDPAPLCTGYYTRTDVEFFRTQVILNNTTVETDSPVLRDRTIIICKSNTVLPGCKSTKVIVFR